jgi:hypothetical protein
MAPLKSEGKQTFEVEIRINTAAKPTKSTRRTSGESRSGRRAKPSAAERGRSRTNHTTPNHKQKESESWSAS